MRDAWVSGVPAVPGTYVLWFDLSRAESVSVGRLGEIVFSPGVYLYVGSAFGPGGLRARLGRHLHGGGCPHWHVDALRAVVPVRGYCYTVAPEPLECRWSGTLARLPQASVPVPRFGASDCREGCPAHLVAFGTGVDLIRLREVLEEAAGASVVAVDDVGGGVL